MIKQLYTLQINLYLKALEIKDPNQIIKIQTLPF